MTPAQMGANGDLPRGHEHTAPATNGMHSKACANRLEKVRDFLSHVPFAAGGERRLHLQAKRIVRAGPPRR